MSELIGSCLLCGKGVTAFKVWLDPQLVIDHTQHGVCEECFNAPRLLAAAQKRVEEARGLIDMAKCGIERWMAEYPLAVEECDYDAVKKLVAWLAEEEK